MPVSFLAPRSSTTLACLILSRVQITDMLASKDNHFRHTFRCVGAHHQQTKNMHSFRENRHKYFDFSPVERVAISQTRPLMLVLKSASSYKRVKMESTFNVLQSALQTLRVNVR